jgi:hypothetical protein
VQHQLAVTRAAPGQKSAQAQFLVAPELAHSDRRFPERNRIDLTLNLAAFASLALY